MKHTNWVIVTTLAITVASLVLIASAALSGRGEWSYQGCVRAIVLVIGALDTPGI